MKPYCALIVSKPRKLLASCMPSLMHNQFLGLLELLFPLKHKFSSFSHRNSWARTMNQRVEWGILFICYGFLQKSTTKEMLLSLIEIKLLFLYYNLNYFLFQTYVMGDEKSSSSLSFSHDFLSFGQISKVLVFVC